MLTDISSEMVATILPLYLVFGLGLSPLQFGVADGVYQGVTAFVRIGGGFIADRWRRYKEVAAFGYGISAVCKLGLVAVGSAWTALTAVLVLDRSGKGIRTAPRDAMISLSGDREDMGTAFGVHRALDTAGAMLGPLVAFGVLAFAPRAYDSVFVVSFCIALIGLGVLLLFVENPPKTRVDTQPADEVSFRGAIALLGGRRLQGLVLMCTGLALFTMSDGFLYLGLQRQLDFDVRFLPLLYMGTALVYMLLALPVGRLADRVGRGRVFVGGYALLLLVYMSLLLPPMGTPALFVYLAFFGAYYAATDGVLMALASAVLPPDLRASGLALVVTATSLARLLASVVFGVLWTAFGMETAVSTFAVGLVAAMALAGLALRRTAREAAHA
jgi:MFS family permease